MTRDEMLLRADHEHLAAEDALERRKAFAKNTRAARAMREVYLGESEWHRGREAMLRELADAMGPVLADSERIDWIIGDGISGPRGFLQNRSEIDAARGR